MRCHCVHSFTRNIFTLKVLFVTLWKVYNRLTRKSSSCFGKKFIIKWVSIMDQNKIDEYKKEIQKVIDKVGYAI